jgi:hypothetical protein
MTCFCIHPSTDLDGIGALTSSLCATPMQQILKVVAQLSKGINLGEDSAESVDIVETQHPSVIPGRPPFKLYHRPLPGMEKAS